MGGAAAAAHRWDGAVLYEVNQGLEEVVTVEQPFVVHPLVRTHNVLPPG